MRIHSEGTTTYNGWANYETWATALWIGNDPHTANRLDELAQEYWDQTEATSVLTKEEATRYDLAHGIEEWVRVEMVPEVGGLASDLLNAALSEVHWSEIACHALDEVSKNEDGV
jgi:tartrate dehydratase beta subunit/fumarate hydratase class I family protein